MTKTTLGAEIIVRPATSADASEVARIYNHYVENTIVTFEEEPVSVEEMRFRIQEKMTAYPWFIAEDGGGVIGYSYAGKWHVRCAYRFAVESTVYLDARHLGRGVGSLLYRRLLEELRARELHCVMGGIALPNAASVALHEKFGFEKVAHYREVGWKMDRWIDVGYWELMLK